MLYNVHKQLWMCKVAQRFLLPICEVQDIAKLCTEPLVQFAYLCRLPYTSVLSLLFRCFTGTRILPLILTVSSQPVGRVHGSIW